MNGAANLFSVAISISIGAGLLAGVFSVFVAFRSSTGAPANRNTATSILFGTAILLTVLNAVAAALIAVGGMAYVGLLKAALLLTAAFAVVCIIFRLMRGPRSGGSTKARSA
jgi:hypothetical protein